MLNSISARYVLAIFIFRFYENYHAHTTVHKRAIILTALNTVFDA